MPLAVPHCDHFSAPLFRTLSPALLLKEAFGIVPLGRALRGFCRPCSIVTIRKADIVPRSARSLRWPNAVLYDRHAAGSRHDGPPTAETLTL